MTFLGQAAITAPTRTTARALLVTAALLGMVRLGWVEVDGLTVFEATLAEGRAEAVLCGLAGFLIAAHLLQWLGDLLSYQAWNIPGAEPRQRDFDGYKFRPRLHGAVEDALEAAKSTNDESALRNWPDERQQQIIRELQAMNANMGRLSVYAIF